MEVNEPGWLEIALAGNSVDGKPSPCSNDVDTSDLVLVEDGTGLDAMTCGPRQKLFGPDCTTNGSLWFERDWAPLTIAIILVPAGKSLLHGKVV